MLSTERPSAPEILLVEIEAGLVRALAASQSDIGLALRPLSYDQASRRAGWTVSAAAVVVGLDSDAAEGLERLRLLRARGVGVPLAAVSAVPTARVAVEAMKGGASDVFCSVHETDGLVAWMRSAASVAPETGGAAWRNRLTPREAEVVMHIASGSSNKEIGRLLGISPRTVEVHRARIREKLGARNAADLVRAVMSSS